MTSSSQSAAYPAANALPSLPPASSSSSAFPPSFSSLHPNCACLTRPVRRHTATPCVSIAVSVHPASSHTCRRPDRRHSTIGSPATTVWNPHAAEHTWPPDEEASSSTLENPCARRHAPTRRKSCSSRPARCRCSASSSSRGSISCCRTAALRSRNTSESSGPASRTCFSSSSRSRRSYRRHQAPTVAKPRTSRGRVFQRAR
mmetsp:Transcript_25244/g.82912  ORF Transcript_25244/g.82912 Transcript_25244/m.82912 type:complete len:202 (+) Transcript_25244:81-686(+)